ncbi:glycosyl transferase, family 39 [Thermosinus carboxydivorans Nor1]|uniref:Glycosyl transferase, family 39 n=1 Tax=Thermosinus carboxydivorans Nor1 TaxID=401526 RepID=A1HQC0_9FIRM|nr:glycosyltransferase family 39 protein [Thermosinus carboxydivorans]EAX47727.1 glycosyl transferase, family 39 [Thermosinus carboxydivorans Nor1]
MSSKPWFRLLAIICIAAFVMFFRLGSLPLFDPDEPVYAETAREMLQYGDFISPRIYGDFWYDKPPMYYWLVAASISLFGDSEFSARFPSALLALGGVVTVYFAGARLFSNRAGAIAALVLATSFEYFYLGKAAVTDITLTFFLTVSLLSFFEGRYYLAYASAALAVVTKGPIGIVFPAMILGLYYILTRNWGIWRRLRLVSGALVFAVIALPWYGAMYAYHGLDFINTFLGFHNVTRFLQPEHPEGKLWYYYFPVLLVGFFPWTAFLVQAGRAAWRERHSADGAALSFLLIWAGVVFGFFTMSQTKLVSYILPMYPPLALLVGWYIDRALTANHRRAFHIAAALLTLLAGALAAALWLAGAKLAPALMPGVAAVCTALATMVTMVWWSAVRNGGRGTVVSLTVGMMLFVASLMTALLPAAAPAFSMKDFAAAFEARYDGQAPVYVAKFYRPGFMYYTGRPGIEIKAPEQIANVIAGTAGKAYFIMSENAYRKLPASLQGGLQPLYRQEDKVLLLKDTE